MSAGTGNNFNRSMAQFSVCRRPWDEYIRLLSKQDAEPYYAPPHPRPMYRGRKKGREEWNTGGDIQLHFRKYPDEHLVTNLARWRQGDMIGDIGIQQFRNAQPFSIDDSDVAGLNTLEPEVYMKMNYKNAPTIGRFMTRSGHWYPQDIVPLNPQAQAMLRYSRFVAKSLGLFPKQGNPFWYRSQQFRPKPHKGEFDPAKASTTEIMEQYCFNWLQTSRIKEYFAKLHSIKSDSGNSRNTDPQLTTHGSFPEEGMDKDFVPQYKESAPFSIKKPTVPGLQSTVGLRKPAELYAQASKRRMGFKNPLTFRKL